MHSENDFNRRRFLGLAAAGTTALAVTPIIGMTGCSTSWITVAENDLPTIVDIAETLLSVVATLSGNPEITPAVMAIIDEAVPVFLAAVKALQDAIAAYKASPSTSVLAKVTAALNAVEQDAPAVIRAITQAPGSIVSIVTSAIGTIISVISAIQSLIPSVATGNAVAVTPAKRVKVKGVKIPDAQILRSNFNSVLSVYGYGQFAK